MFITYCIISGIISTIYTSYILDMDETIAVLLTGAMGLMGFIMTPLIVIGLAGKFVVNKFIKQKKSY